MDVIEKDRGICGGSDASLVSLLEAWTPEPGLRYQGDLGYVTQPILSIKERS